MRMIYSIGYGNVVDMYMELDNQFVIHVILTLCLLGFDMLLMRIYLDGVCHPVDRVRSSRHEQARGCLM